MMMNTIDTKHTEHKEKKKRLTTRLILTLILVIGMILGGVILKSNKPKPANDHGHDAKENISSKQPVTQTNEHHEAHDDHGHEDKLHAPPPRLYPTEKISLSDAQIKAAGISIQTAGLARIKNSVQLAGEIRFNEAKKASRSRAMASWEVSGMMRR
jgi:cobalt-zinc-cadmium efflux system membrane fusion protein